MGYMEIRDSGESHAKYFDRQFLIHAISAAVAFAVLLEQTDSIHQNAKKGKAFKRTVQPSGGLSTFHCMLK